MFHSFRDTSTGALIDSAAGRVGNGIRTLAIASPAADVPESYPPEAPVHYPLGRCLEKPDKLLTKA
jgi:hypothetical protein